MFLGKLNVGMVLLAAILLFSACTPTGSIVILENPNGTGFTMNLTKFHGTNKCQLSLAAGDVLQVEVSRSGGEMGLGDQRYARQRTVRGKQSARPHLHHWDFGNR